MLFVCHWLPVSASCSLPFSSSFPPSFFLCFLSPSFLTKYIKHIYIYMLFKLTTLKSISTLHYDNQIDKYIFITCNRMCQQFQNPDTSARWVNPKCCLGSSYRGKRQVLVPWLISLICQSSLNDLSHRLKHIFPHRTSIYVNVSKVFLIFFSHTICLLSKCVAGGRQDSHRK